MPNTLRITPHHTATPLLHLHQTEKKQEESRRKFPGTARMNEVSPASLGYQLRVSTESLLSKIGGQPTELRIPTMSFQEQLYSQKIVDYFYPAGPHYT